MAGQMRGVFVLLVAALVLSPVMAGNMGSNQKPSWAVGADGDTSKNIKTEAPKTLQEATNYLYFDDMPTSNSGTLGQMHAPAKTVDTKIAADTPRKAVTAAAAMALKQTEVRLGVKTASSTDKIQSADLDASPTLAQTVGAYFQAASATAAPHQVAVLSGLGVVGFMAAVVVMQRRRTSRHARETDLDVAGTADDREFAPLLVKKRVVAASSNYGTI
mmetsp:Transcript_9801/g.15756  ORF Transcript_9801/g.15756 Transcript_9801/m.15756 type:complete len:217 (+) Transcript_9801:147-797(+)